MVETIDIKTLSMEELSGVVSLYPWYADARREFCARLIKVNACTDTQIAEASVYLPSARVLFEMKRAGSSLDCADESIRENPVEQNSDKPRIFIVGGDYFSRADYEAESRPEDKVFSDFSNLNSNTYEYSEPETTDEEALCTETLAQIYLDQDYPEEAKKIYSKLSLRYPEKSVYFAALIDKINNN